MRKLFLLSSVLFLTFLSVISCSTENDSTDEIDFTELRLSRLKSLVNDSEAIKRRIQEEVMSETEQERDTVPDDGQPDCSGEKMQEVSNSEYNSYGAVLIEQFNSDARLFRDNKMLRGNLNTTGYTYRDVYYYLSGVLKNETISLSELTQFVNIIPTISNIYQRIEDSNYDGIVINSSERDEILDFIDFYRAKVNNNLDKDIIDAIKDDLTNLTNRNRSQINTFLEM